MRGQQVLRQWNVIRKLARGRGNTLRSLAGELGVSDRTIRRDLEVLQEVGFPLVDEVADADTGRVQWRLLGGLDVLGGAR